MRRVLAIDGGGIKGVFPASFLATIEDTIGNNVANYFDLIVGTLNGWNYCSGPWPRINRKGDIGVLRRIWTNHL